MRRISIMTMTTGLALLVSSSSFAADQFTYRAGQAYMKSAATSHTECETQCRGDAACRGWNFVRPNPRSRSGICEFNARKAVPVSSPVSISGEIITGVDALMSHAVPLTGNMAGMGGNTVRVGTPIVPNRQIPKRRIAAPQMATAPRTGQQKRIVRRMPVPTSGQVPTSATYKRTIPAQKTRVQTDVRTPRIYGGEAPQVQTQPQVQKRQMQKRSMTRQQIYREQMLAAQKQAAQQQQIQMQRQAVARIPQQRIPQQRTSQQNPYAQPQTRQQQFGQPQAQQAPRMPQQNPYAPNPYAQNPYAQSPYAQQRQPQGQVPQQMQMAPNQMVPNQASLYGSLHDDLTQNMTAVPRPQTAPDQAANPDAPLSTSRAVPTKPVQAEPIGYPAIPGQAISGLAGGE